MAVVISVRWDGFTPEQYDVVRALVPFDRATAPGGLFHVVAFDERGIRVTDVWESEEQFRAYLTDHLQPAFAHVGITGRPEVEVLAVHTFTMPGFTQD